MPQNRRPGNHRTSGSCAGDVGGREDDIGAKSTVSAPGSSWRATYSISRGWTEPGEKNLLAALK